MTEESRPPGTTRSSRLFQSVPGLQVLRSYQAKNLAPDILAGLVICLVLIPSALAYAELAGSGPVGGIYTALTGGDPTMGLIAGAWLALFTGIILIRVVIDASAMPTMDFTALEKLRPFLENLDAQGVELAVARAHLPLRELNLGSDLNHLLPEERTFSQISDAVAAFKARTGLSAGWEPDGGRATLRARESKRRIAK